MHRSGTVSKQPKVRILITSDKFDSSENSDIPELIEAIKTFLNADVVS